MTGGARRSYPPPALASNDLRRRRPKYRETPRPDGARDQSRQLVKRTVRELNRFPRAAVTLSREPDHHRAPCRITRREPDIASRRDPHLPEDQSRHMSENAPPPKPPPSTGADDTATRGDSVATDAPPPSKAEHQLPP